MQSRERERELCKVDKETILGTESTNQSQHCENERDLENIEGPSVCCPILVSPLCVVGWLVKCVFIEYLCPSTRIH